MSQSNNEIKYQAHQGSISAIIFILNEQLKDDGITIKAVLDQGKLQILCEADRMENLDQSSVVEKIKMIFNQILPSNFSKVIINSRITKKQQSLWLEEIQEDRENNLLWYQEITIKKPNILHRFFLKYQYSQKPEVKNKEILQDLAKEKVKSKKKLNKNFPWKLTFLISLSLLIIGGGSWFLFRFFQNFQPSQTSKIPETSPSPKLPTIPPPPDQTNIDPFYEAVTLANSAYGEGIKATNKNQWLEIAKKWQKASELMKEVKPDHPRFREAQERIESYQKNSDIALYKANQY